ncbi:MAG: hypothetical protein AB8H80_16005 [Planctomycetota bacterium]
MFASLNPTPAGLRKHTRFLYGFAVVCLAIGLVGLAITGGSIGWAVCLILGGKFLGVASTLKGRAVHRERQAAGALTGGTPCARPHPWYLSATAIAFYQGLATAPEPAVMMRTQARSQLLLGIAFLAAGTIALMSTGGCDALALPLIYGGGALGAAMALGELAAASGLEPAPAQSSEVGQSPGAAPPPPSTHQPPDCP